MADTVHDHLEIDEPILPAVGLGGLRIGDPVISLERLLNRLPDRFTGLEWALYIPLWELRFKLGQVDSGVDIRSGRIFKLIARQGYRGELFDCLRVGMTVSQARQFKPELQFDEPSSCYVFPGCPGLAIDVGIDDPDPSVAEFMPIAAISVYDPQLWRDYR